ncbi:MAG: lipid-A-disaccharide synthase N-terminal domain-containing protein [Desulfobacterales bacterium]|nr:lipid-A-disaccharide synthase N-terminal domain-containing protein [Desulfobacterales bacterium]
MNEFLKILGSKWVIIGFVGQTLFFVRWIVQWFCSEKRQESYVPFSFWVISLIGGFLVLLYAIQRHDPVFIVGQVVGLVTYSRNVVLVLRKKS